MYILFHQTNLFSESLCSMRCSDFRGYEHMCTPIYEANGTMSQNGQVVHVHCAIF